MGVPLDHPFTDGFSLQNHPALGEPHDELETPGKIPAMSRRDLPFVSGESLPEEKPIQKKPTASGNRSSRSPVMVTEELVCPGSMEDIVLMDVKYVHEVYEPTFQGNHLLASLYPSRFCPTEVSSSTDTSSSRRISSRK